MDNSFFLRSKHDQVEIKKFQICTWEFNNNSSLVEFGVEINSNSIQKTKKLSLELYIPWLEKGCKLKDFYDKLKSSDNSRFIFNDSVSNTVSFDGGQNTQGVMHEFSGRNKLCILPVKITPNLENRKIQLTINLSDYKQKADPDTNVYIRISVESKIETISTKKKGIGKSTIIYDVKLNEERNIPSFLINEFKDSIPCKIETCFCFHIIPNSYNITFLESEHLKNVRTLEFEPFKNYLEDKRLKKDDLIVVFSKKNNNESYSFFSIYTKERIGASQFAIAILINIVCGFLFALPSIRTQIPVEASFEDMFQILPLEFYLASFLTSILLLYFFLPPIILGLKRLKFQIIS